MSIRKYETMIIFESTLTEEQFKGEVEKIQQFIKDNKGEVTEVDEWGKRKLAYEINKKNEGYYVVVYFELDNNKLKELERYYRLNENIIRFIVLNQK